ncbi:hypothetical protein K435DRAFT_959002 [Dendrothele bispora CBS 962.96]|uniref:Glycosyltransferase family 32 protein n=1 Tax=Dendrothele bispora (strain CBS 962.96) TaxID=1314807 RepID=A0A4S8MYG7_DENBC|nr:hypothetical protein K435DRAFT_959002 [Dendrothele bispora CBS 962.96]
MARRRPLFVFLVILGLFLVGTVVVLSSVTYYLAIDPSAYLSELEVPILENNTRWNASDHGQVERIPRILHQTWRTETLPPRWKTVSQECRDMMPDYDYKLWTDESSRTFIEEHYPWFLDTFDGYEYNIQRADAIRYFVLHHYGGIYLDLDIGCIRPLDPLLVYPVILPKTIPVGVSNDLMFAEKGHPFLYQTIRNLVTFDHSWVLNYPTVMFSTGPMFLSAQYGMYASSRASDTVRILPKSLYGKNAKEGEAPNSFFTHFYGSSWHDNDAAFIGFLGHWGKGLLWIGLIILLGGLALIALPGRQRRYSLRRIGGYDVLFPRLSQRTGHWHFHLPRSAMSSSSTSSSDDSAPTSPIDSDISVLHLPFDMRPSSPAPSDVSFSNDQHSGHSSPLLDTFRRMRTRVAALAGGVEERQHLRSRRHRQSRGYLFFLPAIFTTQPADVEIGSEPVPMLSRPIPRTPQRYTDEHPDGSSTSNHISQSEAQLIDFEDDDHSARSKGGPRDA